MSTDTLVKDLAESLRSVSEAAELYGQEHTIIAVLDQLKSRGADDLELAVFEKAVRERLEYSNENL